MVETNQITVEIIFAAVDQLWRKTLKCPVGFTVGEALAGSGLHEAFPDLSADSVSVGIFGVACAMDQVLSDDDRVEIYRPLHFDPKESRRRRALHKLSKKRARR